VQAVATGDRDWRLAFFTVFSKMALSGLFQAKCVRVHLHGGQGRRPDVQQKQKKCRKTGKKKVEPAQYVVLGQR
jgi:hypothetical protein